MYVANKRLQGNRSATPDRARVCARVAGSVLRVRTYIQTNISINEIIRVRHNAIMENSTYDVTGNMVIVRSCGDCECVMMHELGPSESRLRTVRICDRTAAGAPQG